MQTIRIQGAMSILLSQLDGAVLLFAPTAIFQRQGQLIALNVVFILCKVWTFLMNILDMCSLKLIHNFVLEWRRWHTASGN
jgi:hypothetical protein